MPSPSGTKGLAITEAEPLKPYTTFKIGGPARYFARAASLEEFRGALELAAKAIPAAFRPRRRQQHPGE